MDKKLEIYEKGLQSAIIENIEEIDVEYLLDLDENDKKYWKQGFSKGSEILIKFPQQENERLGKAEKLIKILQKRLNEK